MMQPPCSALARGFLLAHIAGQLGLTGGLLLNDGRDEVPKRFELMPVCPGPEKREIIAQTSRERVLRCPTPKLSQGLRPCLLATSEKVSQHQVAGIKCQLRFRKVLDIANPLGRVWHVTARSIHRWLLWKRLGAVV